VRLGGALGPGNGFVPGHQPSSRRIEPLPDGEQPHGTLVVVPGAAALSDQRSHGIHAAMTTARLAADRAIGKDGVVLHGDRKTSALNAATARVRGNMQRRFPQMEPRQTPLIARFSRRAARFGSFGPVTTGEQQG